MEPLITIDCEGGGVEETLTVELPEIEPIAAVTMDDPAATPVTTPELFTVATDVVALVHVGEEHGAVEESEKVEVHVKVTVEPTLTDSGLGVTAMEVRVTDPPVTVTVDDPEIDPIVAEITLVPAATPVTTPFPTVACEGVALVQTGDAHGAVEESEKVDVQVRVRVLPTATEPGFGASAIDVSVGAVPPTLTFVTDDVDCPKSPSA